MKIKFLKAHKFKQNFKIIEYQEGDTIDVHNSLANAWIKTGIAKDAVPAHAKRGRPSKQQAGVKQDA